MAVTCVGVGTGQSTSSASVASSSITPAANKLYLAVVATRAASSPNIPTVAGCGATWVQIATRVDASNFRRITVFRAMKASGLSAGAVTATISGNQTVSLISILELDGIDTGFTDGSGAIVTSAQNGSTSNVASPVTISMSAWGDSVNGAAVSCFWHGNAEVSTPKSGWTETSDQAGVSSTCLQTQFKVGQDTSPQVSWGGSNTSWGGIAIEIKPVAATVYNQTPSGGIIFGGSSDLSKAFDLPQSGGIVLGGSCSSSLVLSGPTYNLTPSGGIVFTDGATLVGGGNDAYTVLLLHNDGPNGSQTFIDSSAAAHPMTSGAGTPAEVSISTAHSKFGGSSAHFAASGWAYVYTPTAADLEFGSGDWTIDFWAYHEDISNAAIYVGKYDQWNPRSWRLMWNIWAGTFTFDYTSDGINNYQILPDAPWSPTVNHDHHIALVRFGNALKFFVDGTQIGTDRPITGPIGPSGANLMVNNEDTYARYPMVGYLDELRISKGIARWTANFTPPSAPYSVPTGGGGSSVLVSLARDVTPSGGIILNGSIVSDWTGGTVTYNLAPSGGIVLGGTQTNTKAVSTTQTGGIVLGGSVSQTLIRAVTPSGGIVLGGSVAVTTALTINVAPSGGVVLGGSVITQIGGATSVAPIGGIVLGGSCVIAHTFPAVPTGGIVLGGTCATVRSVVITVAPSGGIVLGGSVSTALIPPGPTYTLTPGGGLVLGGTCTSSLNLVVVYTSTPSGGIRLDGLAVVSQAAVIFPISDLSDGTWTDQVGGSNLWAAIDETSPSDADYIKSATSPVTADICQVEFPGTYDPQLSTGHALTYRYGSDQEGWTTVTQVLTGAQADAISNYNAISVKFEAKS